jgi:perosamine synthetase
MSSLILDERYDLPKTRLMEFLDQRQIDSRPFFHPLSSLPAYAQLEESARARARNVVSYRVSPRAINLPSPLNLTEAQAERVCAAVREILHA